MKRATFFLKLICSLFLILYSNLSIAAQTQKPKVYTIQNDLHFTINSSATYASSETRHVTGIASSQNTFIFRNNADNDKATAFIKFFENGEPSKSESYLLSNNNGFTLNAGTRLVILSGGIQKYDFVLFKVVQEQMSAGVEVTLNCSVRQLGRTWRGAFFSPIEECFNMLNLN